MKQSLHKNIFSYHCVILLSIIIITCTMGQGIAITPQEPRGEIQQTYRFSEPTLTQITLNGMVYNHVGISDISNGGRSGEPNLPIRNVALLLPQGTTVQDIKVQVGNTITLRSDRFIEPIGQPLSLNSEPQTSTPVLDKRIYSSSNIFPDQIFSLTGVYTFRGFDILIGQIYPVRYSPLSGELLYTPDITLTIALQNDGHIGSTYRGLEKDFLAVKEKVDNPEITATYLSSPKHLTEEYDLLIITTDTLQSGFVPLKDAHEAQGLHTVIKTTTDIGSSNPDTIRNYIHTAFTTWGITYVLIGADHDIIPAKMLWVAAYPGGESDTMPSDLYYACLDGTYNYDGDSFWGEPTDGDGGGDVDLMAEVYVGRATVGTAIEVSNFVGKTITSLNTGGYASGTALMVGEYLGFGGDSDWGGNHMDELIDGSTAHGYTTVGIPSSQYTIDKLYDRDWPGHDWPKSELISRLNNNPVFVNHLGHANSNYVMKLYTSDVSGLTNTEPFFAYSQGCIAGAFDQGDCIAEYFTVKTTHAAFAVIMNARYGWGRYYSTDGPSQRFHREFWDAVFGETINQFGAANQDSKEDNLYRVNEECMRWCYYELNLLGDPSLNISRAGSGNQPPGQPTRPDGPTHGQVGESYSYTTNATDPDNDRISYGFDWDGNGVIDEWTELYDSKAIVEKSHTWTIPDTYDVKVKAKDEHNAMSVWSQSLTVTISESIPILSISNIRGGMALSFDIVNDGTADATNVQWTVDITNGTIIIPRHGSDTIDIIPADNSQTISMKISGLGLGLLKPIPTITIRVQADDVDSIEQVVPAQIFLIFIVIK